MQSSTIHTQAQCILSLPVWAAGHAQKNASGRPGASEGKARCDHATQREPALAKENWSSKVSQVCVLLLGLPVWVSHLRGTRRLDKFALEQRPDGDTNQQPDMSIQCCCISIQQTQTNLKDVERYQDGFLSITTKRRHRKESIQLSAIWWGSCLDIFVHRWSQVWPSAA